MKRILYIFIATMLLLTACTKPMPKEDILPEQIYTQGVYELTFSVEQISGGHFDDWVIVYTHNGETISSGHEVLLSLEIFTFQSVRIDVIEKSNPNNAFTATFPVAICDGGSGKTEITVTTIDGQSSTFKINCDVNQTGKR